MLQMSNNFSCLCYLSIQIFGFICSHYVFHFSFTPFGALYLFKGEPLILLIFRAEKRKLRRQRKKMNLLYLKKMKGKRVMMVITIRFVLKYLRLDWLVFIYKSIKPHTPQFGTVVAYIYRLHWSGSGSKVFSDLKTSFIPLLDWRLRIVG